MLPSALGATTAVWLLLAPVLEVQSGPRSQIAVAVGVAALILSPLGVWRRAPRPVLALLGLCLALINFALPGSVIAMADFATCAFALILAGLADRSEVTRVAPVASALVPQRAREESDDEWDTPTRRLPKAS